MTDIDREKFSRLCSEDAYMHGKDADGIGTYNEKRLHRILKRYVTENAECYEVRVGGNIADVLENGRITEIQTSSFRPLEKKISSYLENTDYSVTVLCPVICEKMLIRADKDTGEVMKAKKSPKKGRVSDVLPNLFYLREHISSPRLEVRILLINAEEYRFSERMRYRKAGAYDCDLRPVEIVSETVLTDTESYRQLVLSQLGEEEFTSAEFGKITRLQGRRQSLALAFLIQSGLVNRRAEGRKYIYSIQKKS